MCSSDLVEGVGAAGFGAGAGVDVLDDCVSAKPFGVLGTPTNPATSFVNPGAGASGALGAGKLACGAPPIFFAIPTALPEPSPGEEAANLSFAILPRACIGVVDAAGAVVSAAVTGADTGAGAVDGLAPVILPCFVISRDIFAL